LQIRNTKGVEGLKVKPNKWFGIIVLFTLLTLLIVYVVPSDSPFSVLSYVFGFIFVSIVPGYCLVSVLFPAENKLDSVEKAVLSVALSFSLVGLSGLFLGLSPIGMNFTSIRVSVSIMVLVLAAVAFIRKSSLGKSYVQSSEQVST
jgi:uncharacterized membrane protein